MVSPSEEHQDLLHGCAFLSPPKPARVVLVIYLSDLPENWPPEKVGNLDFGTKKGPRTAVTTNIRGPGPDLSIRRHGSLARIGKGQNRGGDFDEVDRWRVPKNVGPQMPEIFR